MGHSRPDLGLLDGVVTPRVLEAMRAASRALAALGVRHAVAGGLAVGAHGYPRTTVVVDLLVGDEAFDVRPGGFVSLKPGVPVQIDGISVDLLSAGDSEPFLSGGLRTSADGVVPVVDVGTLVYLKLKSARLKDQADVVELLKAGIDAGAAREYLDTNAPGLIPRFESCLARARAEE